MRSLLDLDLIDELRLMVFPIVIGKGKRLFGDTSEAKSLDLVESKVLGDGVFLLTYRPAHNGARNGG